MILTLLIYLAFIAVFATFSVVLFYHLARYSLVGDLSQKVFIIYLASSGALILLTLLLLIINRTTNAS